LICLINGQVNSMSHLDRLLVGGELERKFLDDELAENLVIRKFRITEFQKLLASIVKTSKQNSGKVNLN
jgi:hypothetical protein